MVQTGPSEKMSKSRKNVVDPDGLVARHGADTVRLFVLSLAPPEVDLQWSDRGIHGARRFLSRVFQLTHEAARTPRGTAVDPAVRAAVDEAIRTVTEELEGRLHLPRAIAALYTLEHVLTRAFRSDAPATRSTVRSGVEVLARLLSPFTPHLADELHAILGGTDFVLTSPWPDANREEPGECSIAVQIDGRVRGRVALPAGADEAQALASARALPAIATMLAGAPPSRVVYVPGRAINLLR